jgi:hypothetical protein
MNLINTHSNRIHYHEKARTCQISPKLLNQFTTDKSWKNYFPQYWSNASSSNSWWILEIQRGGENASDSPRPGSSPYIRIDEILVHRLERDSYTTARKLAYSLGISLQMVMIHLQKSLGMKYSHLRWILYLLTSSHKTTRLGVAKIMFNNWQSMRMQDFNIHWQTTSHRWHITIRRRECGWLRGMTSIRLPGWPVILRK